MSLEGRKSLHRHQKGRCYWCFCEVEPVTASIDHVIPRSLGGRGSKNLVLSCKPCNKEKSCLRPQEFVKRRLMAFNGFIKSEGFKRYAKG